MTRLQRIASFNLTLAGVCLILQLLRLVAGETLISLFASTVTVILGCAMLVSYLRCKKLVNQGGSEYDERDRSIHTTAALTGLGTAFMVSFLTTFLAFLIVGPGGKLEIGLFICVLLSPGVYILYREKSLEVRFDEREKMIDRRAFIAAAIALAIFLGGACTLPFAVLGGQSVIKVCYLPLIFIAAVLIAQLVHSSAVLIMCALEGDDG